VAKVAPKARYVSGKGASGAGLTASVVKDEFLSGWSLEAGALVLANKGICMIDELDKMSIEDRSAMHEALEQQTVTISKANIQATLRAETTVLAAANPKLGRFDPYEPLAKQIALPPTLINRFDLIFPIRDMPDKSKDEIMADFILSLHKNPEGKMPEIPTQLLRKYVAYAKQNIHPKLTEEAVDEIKNYYLKMRGSGVEEGSIKSIPISARQLEALVRLAEASAKMRLSQKVTREDARRAVDLVHFCLTQVGLDPETGQIDIDRISTGITTSERSKIISIREIIHQLEDELGKTIPIEDIIREATAKGIDEEAVDEAIERLKRSGDIFEPKPGFIQRI
ncbi:AAA family ATPase, partial [Candidatus Woesearchaeota archaeon]